MIGKQSRTGTIPEEMPYPAHNTQRRDIQTPKGTEKSDRACRWPVGTQDSTDQPVRHGMEGRELYRPARCPYLVSNLLNHSLLLTDMSRYHTHLTFTDFATDVPPHIISGTRTYIHKSHALRRSIDSCSSVDPMYPLEPREGRTEG